MVRVLPRADADLDAAAEYYANEAGVAVALRFLRAVERAYEFLASRPKAGSPGQYHSRKLEGIRRWPVPEFENYLVFYRMAGGSVEIVRVLHGARDIESLFEVEE